MSSFGFGVWGEGWEARRGDVVQRIAELLRSAGSIVVRCFKPVGSDVLNCFVEPAPWGGEEPNRIRFSLEYSEGFREDVELRLSKPARVREEEVAEKLLDLLETLSSDSSLWQSLPGDRYDRIEDFVYSVEEPSEIRGSLRIEDDVEEKKHRESIEFEWW